jgi:hypothetical protein
MDCTYFCLIVRVSTKKKQSFIRTLTLSIQIRVAAEKAAIGLTFVGLGLHPGVNSVNTV